MEPKDFSYTDPDNTLSGIFRKLGCKRVECLLCPNTVEGFVDVFLDSVDAFSLCDAVEDGLGAAGDLLYICEGLVRGSIGAEERPWLARAKPLLEKLSSLEDRDKKRTILFMELSDSFLEKKSKAYAQELLEDKLEREWFSAQYQNLEDCLGKEEAERLYQNLCEMFVVFPVMQAYRQGYYECVARRLRTRDKETGRQIWHEWCDSLTK